MDKHTKELLQALIAGKNLQVRSSGSVERWLPVSSPYDLLHCYEHADLRVQPSTIKIGDMEVPAPETVAPPMHKPYWLPALTTRDHHSGEHKWVNDDFDVQALKRGLVHLSAENAEIHGQALIKVSGGEI